MTVRIDMGSTPTGQAATLDLEELLATRLLVQGNSGSGKSHLLRRLLEQSASWVQQVIIDPEGDFVTLGDRFGHIAIDAADHTELALQRVAERVRQHRISVVLNLEGLDAELQMRHAASFLNGLFDADRDFWYPLLVVVDEAQLFAPSAAGEVADDARRLSLTAMTNLMCRGRKRGLAGVIATQRLAKLAKNVAAEASNFLMGRTFLDIDMARAADLLGMERRQAEMFRDVERGHFIALGPALSKRPAPIRIGAVETAARSGSPKLTPLPETPPTDARDLIMSAAGEPDVAPPPRRRPAVAPGAAVDLMAQISRARPPVPSGPAVSRTVLADPWPLLDDILRPIVGDPDAGSRSVAVLYQDFLVRCRALSVNGTAVDLSTFRRRLALVRAGIDGGMLDGPEGAQALAAATTVPEDLQGVFLLLVRAALTKAPCPGDDEVARAYGTQSLGRARRLLSYMAEGGHIELRTVSGARRIIAIPELGWETAPGDPNAAAPIPAAD
ncbi:MAG: DUF87 domain-containing protein [Azospirillaceae bacterium]|nr:DUF87 domain-containing protein [Azospirillaceae bacterium]